MTNLSTFSNEVTVSNEVFEYITMLTKNFNLEVAEVLSTYKFNTYTVEVVKLNNNLDRYALRMTNTRGKNNRVRFSIVRNENDFNFELSNFKQYFRIDNNKNKNIIGL